RECPGLGPGIFVQDVEIERAIAIKPDRVAVADGKAVFESPGLRGRLLSLRDAPGLILSGLPVVRDLADTSKLRLTIGVVRHMRRRRSRSANLYRSSHAEPL